MLKVQLSKCLAGPSSHNHSRIYIFLYISIYIYIYCGWVGGGMGALSLINSLLGGLLHEYRQPETLSD